MLRRQTRSVPLHQLTSSKNFQPRGNCDEPTLSDKLYRIPENQRLFKWKLSTKQLLVDSVLLDFPIHGIIMTEHRNVHGVQYFNIADGQCRLTSLFEFQENLYSIKYNQIEYTFATLPIELRDQFRDYQVFTETYYDPSPSQLADIFERLNSGRPLSSNDKYHNRGASPVVSYIPELIEQFQPQFARFTKSKRVCRSILGDMIGAILSTGFKNKMHISNSYCINGLYLSEFTEENKTKVVEFFTQYFEMLGLVLPSNGKTNRKYGKLSGVLGLALTSWIIKGSIIEPIKWYIFKLLKNPKYEPKSYDSLNTGDRRNSQGEAITRRLDAIEEQFILDNGQVGIESNDNLATESESEDESEDDSV